MSDSVALLGVKGGPAIYPGSNMPTSILLTIEGKTILVDAGLGVSKSVCDQGVALTDIDAIFITHLHSDHYLELGPLIHTSWVAGRHTPLDVYGPSRLQHYWDAFLTSMEDDINLRIADEGRTDLAKMVTCHVLEGDAELDLSGVLIKSMLNMHPPIKESFALRFEWRDKVVVLSGDTAFMPEMIDFAAGADLLVHEVILSEGIDAIMRRLPNVDERLRQHLIQSHTPAEDVGHLAAAAKVKALALHHFVPDNFPEFSDEDWIRPVAASYQGKLIMGRDGLKIDL